MQRQALPPELGRAFHVRDAKASGVSRSRLRADDLDRPFRGVYVRRAGMSDTATRESEIVERACLAALHLQAPAFTCHVTGAVVWQLPLPLAALGDELDFGVFHPARPPRVSGIAGHRVLERHATLRTHPTSGLLVASPASIWAMLGGVLRHPYDLVAVGDAVISDRRHDFAPPLGSFGQLTNVAAAGRRVGIGALRDALTRIRPHVASRTETWTRLTLVDAGLPEPAINFHVYEQTGRFVACVDLAYPDLKIAVEYEGLHHLLDEHQWTKDIDRYERLAAAGWVVIRVTKDELFQHPESLVARVRRAVSARG